MCQLFCTLPRLPCHVAFYILLAWFGPEFLLTLFDLSLLLVAFIHEETVGTEVLPHGELVCHG